LPAIQRVTCPSHLPLARRLRPKPLTVCMVPMGCLSPALLSTPHSPFARSPPCGEFPASFECVVSCPTGFASLSSCLRSPPTKADCALLLSLFVAFPCGLALRFQSPSVPARTANRPCTFLVDWSPGAAQGTRPLPDRTLHRPAVRRISLSTSSRISLP